MSDILRHKGTEVVTVDPSVTVGALVALLAEQRIGAAVVSTDGVHVIGIVSERDVVVGLAAHGARLLDQEVGEVCTLDVSLADPHDSLDDLMAVMTERRLRHLPVVVDSELCGLVSIGDVVKARLGELAIARSALSDYSTGSR